MTAWNGEFIEILDVRKEMVFLPSIDNRNLISADTVHEGTHSLEIPSGGSRRIPAVAEAGTRTIDVWAYSPPGGYVRVRLIARGLETVLDEAWSSISGGWEIITLSASGLAKGVYLVELSNFTPRDGDVRAFFDALEIS